MMSSVLAICPSPTISCAHQEKVALSVEIIRKRKKGTYNCVLPCTTICLTGASSQHALRDLHFLLGFSQGEL